MALQENVDGEITQHEVWKVSQNVLVALAIALFGTMSIIGFVLLQDCENQPMVAVYLILQGITGQILPILFIIKYRCGAPIRRVIFLSVFITTAVLSVGWLIAGTHWLATANCPEANVRRAGIGFITVLWMTVGVSVIACGLKGVIYLINRHRDGVQNM